MVNGPNPTREHDVKVVDIPKIYIFIQCKNLECWFQDVLPYLGLMVTGLPLVGVSWFFWFFGVVHTLRNNMASLRGLCNFQVDSSTWC